MSSHVRVLLFCLSLVVAPISWSIGLHFGSEITGAVIAVACIVATAIYANSGQPKPPAGSHPS